MGAAETQRSDPPAGALLNALPQPAVILDHGGAVVAVNARFETYIDGPDRLGERLAEAWRMPARAVLDGAASAEVTLESDGAAAIRIRVNRIDADGHIAGALVVLDGQHAALRAELATMRTELEIGQNARIILHDMANVLTRATVSASLIHDYLRESRLPHLQRVAALLAQPDVSPVTITTVARYLAALHAELDGERQLIAKEAQQVLDGIGTVRERLHARSRKRSRSE